MSAATPSFQHTTVLLHEAVAALSPEAAQAGAVFADLTFGRGGHSRLLLEQLPAHAKLVAFDRDLTAVAAAHADPILMNDPRFTMVHAAFDTLPEWCTEHGVKLSGVLADLGVSSPQLDEAARGFSFRFDAPLDMRMDTSCGETAAEFVNTATEAELRRVIHEYGEERFAARIATSIVTGRVQQPIATTGQLAEIVSRAVHTREPGKDPATRTFQAIRIHINAELAQLQATLDSLASVCHTGARLAVISFHSLEDRITKLALRAPPVDVALRHLPIAHVAHPWKELKKVKASAAECKANPRARSAMMRVAVKI